MQLKPWEPNTSTHDTAFQNVNYTVWVTWSFTWYRNNFEEQNSGTQNLVQTWDTKYSF